MKVPFQKDWGENISGKELGWNDSMGTSKEKRGGKG